MKEIIFTNTYGFDFFPPKPAIKNIPEWYKNMEEYLGNKKEIWQDTTTIPGTIKKCMPVFDAMTAGYILFTQVDVQVSQKDGAPYFNWASQNAIDFHAQEQALLHPVNNGAPFPKWMNSYTIQTPQGYSSLLVQPMHNDNKIFTILPGIVDTDSYFSPVNFPFVLNDLSWTGIIPAGTPMVQVIPFKRDSWEHKIGGEKEIKDSIRTFNKVKTKFFNSYKYNFWNRKEFK